MNDKPLSTAVTEALGSGPTAADPELLTIALADADLNWRTFLEWISKNLVDKVDFGVVPGTKKPSLWQPGAEKIAGRLGWQAERPDAEKLVDLNLSGQLPAEIMQRVILRNSAGKQIGEGIGAYPLETEVNVWENKQKVGTKLVRDLNKALQMSFKRAFVAAVKSTAGISAVFTMDLAETVGDTGPISDHPAELKYLEAKAQEWYGDLWEDTLMRLAEQRFRVKHYREIPMAKSKLAIGQLRSRAKEADDE